MYKWFLCLCRDTLFRYIFILHVPLMEKLSSNICRITRFLIRVVV